MAPEWAVPFSCINRTLPLPLYIGFGRDDGEYAPMLQNPMAEVSCTMESSPSASKRCVVLPKVMNVREEPSPNGNVILQLDAGARINVNDNAEYCDGYLWVGVDLDGGQTGWVADDLILPDEPVVTERFPQSYVINKNGVEKTAAIMNWSG